MSDDTTSRAEQLVSDYIDNFDEWTSDEYEARAREMARNAELNEPINRAPSSIAAGAIYACGLLVNEKRTQDQVSAACGVSKPTISDVYAEILAAEGFDVKRADRGQQEIHPRSENKHLMRSVIRDRLSRIVQAFPGGERR